MKEEVNVMKTNSVIKSEAGWRKFRERTQSGRYKRPAVIWNTGRG